MTAVFLLLAALSQLNPQPASDTFTEELSKFEAMLTSDPDNLRHGNDYRRIVIKAKAHDRGIKFFEKLVTENPGAANALFNLGLAYVDKMPISGAITQSACEPPVLPIAPLSLQTSLSASPCGRVLVVQARPR